MNIVKFAVVRFCKSWWTMDDIRDHLKTKKHKTAKNVLD